MKIENRNAVLGLETARAVFVTFLILAVTGVAIILSLTALNDSVGDTIDNVNRNIAVTNESDLSGDIVFINSTGYTLNNYNSTWSSITISSIFADWNQTNGTQSGILNTPTGYNVSVPESNYTLSSGVLTNATGYVYPNVSVSYSAVYVEDTQKTDNIVGNVSGGLETFFASTGTIFSILIVVVIILAISIIIWAVGRFGDRMDTSVNL